MKSAPLNRREGLALGVKPAALKGWVGPVVVPESPGEARAVPGAVASQWKALRAARGPASCSSAACRKVLEVVWLSELGVVRPAQ